MPAVKYAAFAFLLLIRCADAAGSAADFPAATTLCSPDGKWCVVGRSAEGGDEPHSLSLEDSATHAQRLLLRYGRHVRVLWAPDSKTLAITDAEGSDSSRSWLIPVPGRARVDVGERILESDPALAPLMRNHHAYVDAVRFLDGQRLLVAAHGYGDQSPDGFQRCYAVGTKRFEVSSQRCP